MSGSIAARPTQPHLTPPHHNTLQFYTHICPVQYPAAYATSLDNMIAVAATDTNDYLTSWSNYGG